MASWSPSTDDLERVFLEQNPWHVLGEVPSSLARVVERPLGQMLWQRLVHDNPRRFQLVLGPRRVGKSTVLYQTVRHLISEGVAPSRVWWLRMDHPLLMQRSLGDIVQVILDRREATIDDPLYLMLDELVYANDWDLWLKTFYDDRWPLRIAATSSATAALRDRRLESGVGRWEEQYLMPYLFPDFLDLINQSTPPIEVKPSLGSTIRALAPDLVLAPQLDPIRQLFMLTGGFPELLTAFADDADRSEPDALLKSQQTLRNDAVERAIYKDIPQSFGVDNPLMLERLLYVLAGQIGGLLSPTNICGELGMSQPTLDRYLSYLERAFLIFTLPNYSGSEASVQRRGRKLYFLDAAIRNAALQRGLAPLSDPNELGALTENLVAASVKSLGLQSGHRLYHWRDKGNEVDLVVDHPTEPFALEIASSATHHRKGLAALIERYPRFAERSYLVAPNAILRHAYSNESGIGSLPTNALLFAVAAQARQALCRSLGVTDV